jgi:hypothetical protein
MYTNWYKMQNAEPINALNLQHIRNDRIQIHNGLNADLKKKTVALLRSVSNVMLMRYFWPFKAQW